MKDLIKSKLRSDKGFTLVELMIVLVILVLIVIIAIPVFGNIMGNSEESSYESSLDMIEKAASIAYSDAKLNDTSLEADEYYRVGELIEAGYLELELDSTSNAIQYGGEYVITAMDGAVQAVAAGERVETRYDYMTASEIDALIESEDITEKASEQ